MDKPVTRDESNPALIQRLQSRSQPIIISANSFWNIVNFRSGLIDELIERGYRPIIASPEPDGSWVDEKGVVAARVRVDRSGLNPFADFQLFMEYMRIFRRTNSRLYLGFTVKPNIYGSIAAKLSGATALPNVSGLGTTFISGGPLSHFVGWLYRLAFRRCPIVFFQNPDDRDLFVERRLIRSDQARLLPGSGIDTEYFAPAGPEPDTPMFLYIGRLLGDKGVREFVDAARMLRKANPTWKFQLLGPLDAENRTTIPRHELDGWIDEGLVEYLGSANDVRPFIAAATAIVLPSYREGLPRSLLEGAAMARPLVATDVPGNRQLVEHGVNGLLCAVRDSVSLADAMRTMGQMSPSDRAAMGRAGRQVVEKTYREEEVINTYLAALTQLQAGREV